jgi:WD40 repeat protein
VSAAAQAPLPPVLRSRRALEEQGVSFLAPGAVAPGDIPINEGGATYSMAQEAQWLDDDHFAVGRWDGSLSVFEWSSAPTQGPLITTAASDPTSEGVQMLEMLGLTSFASSRGDSALSVWTAPDGDWTSITSTEYDYDASLGAANSAVVLPAQGKNVLAVGHANGFLSLWSIAPSWGPLSYGTAVDLRNPNPVNPWGLHNIRGVEMLMPPYVVTGSEDGFISVVNAFSGQILTQTVFNPNAQRGINSIALTRTGELLVANCSVGPSDYNLWYYEIDSSYVPKLRDQANLKVNPTAPQVFNFCVTWAGSSNGPCWLSSTEEGALWMGTVDGGSLQIWGYDQVTSPLGSALDYQWGGRLALVSYDLYEFDTGM